MEGTTGAAGASRAGLKLAERFASVLSKQGTEYRPGGRTACTGGTDLRQALGHERGQHMISPKALASFAHNPVPRGRVSRVAHHAAWRQATLRALSAPGPALAVSKSPDRLGMLLAPMLQTPRPREHPASRVGANIPQPHAHPASSHADLSPRLPTSPRDSSVGRGAWREQSPIILARRGCCGALMNSSMRLIGGKSTFVNRFFTQHKRLINPGRVRPGNKTQPYRSRAQPGRPGRRWALQPAATSPGSQNRGQTAPRLTRLRGRVQPCRTGPNLQELAMPGASPPSPHPALPCPALPPWPSSRDPCSPHCQSVPERLSGRGGRRMHTAPSWETARHTARSSWLWHA